jgi:DUF1365 family protein
VVLAETNNTYGATHNYWVHQHGEARKSLYVSPFMAADLDYAFAFSRPEASLVAHIATSKEGRRLFDATLRLERRPWTAAEIRRALVRYPLMTASVIAAIHWEALRLWWKGLPAYPRSP